MLKLGGFSGGQGSWVRRLEHSVLRGVSFAFSVGGAYAFASFFSPLDMGDVIQGVITVSLSVALGLAGYFLSRGIADRSMALLDKESNSTESGWSIVVFVPLFLVCEFLEIFTNYAKAIPAIHRTEWLNLVPPDQRPFHVFCTYLAYCCVPLVSPCLAAVDMGLERKKLKQREQQPPPPQGQQPPPPQGQPVRPQGQGQPQRGGAGAPLPGAPLPGVTRQQSVPQSKELELEPV